MKIQFQCTSCEGTLRVDARHAGKRVKCPRCGELAMVPPSEKKQPPKRASLLESEEKSGPLSFGDKDAEEDEGLDMTPMVDVTFLLLIFFMVTAAFSLQKSLEVPTPDQQESATQARTVEEIEEDDDYIIVRIDRDNTVWVNESEAPSRQEVRVKLREAREGGTGSDSKGPSSLLVLADGDARCETVVMVLDVGNAVSMENVRLAMVDENDF